MAPASFKIIHSNKINKKVIFMRLWHVDLIPYLPCKQLISQWRECCCIAKDWADYGSPNHVLVNIVIKYPLIHYIWYCHKVIEEMKNRGYDVREMSIERLNHNIETIGLRDRLFNLYSDVQDPIPKNAIIYPHWHNDRYLLQNYFNLEEKYDRGGIQQWEWEIIEDYVSSRLEHLL